MRTIDDFSRPVEYITPLDRVIGKIIRDWAEKEVIPYRRQFDEDWSEHRLVGPPLEKLLGEYGIQRVLFPADLGGWDLGNSGHLCVTACRVFEEIARADAGMAAVVAVVFWPIMFISVEPHVNRRLCEEFAPMYCQTERAVFSAFCMGEPQGGSDIENLGLLKGSTVQTTAVRDGDEWVINGHKLWPSNTGGVADLLGVVCTTSPGSTDPRDIAIIFVPADTPGLTQGTPYEKAGLASDKNSDVWFENVRVPTWYRACGPGDDAKYFGEMLAMGNMWVIASATGAMMTVYEKLLEFSSRKVYRGRPLKENDAAAGVLADLAATIEVVRILGYQCARMCDRPDLYGKRWSPEIMAKTHAHRYFALDRYIEVLGRVMDLMDAFGPDRNWDVEKVWRDLKMAQQGEGGKQLCQMETARWFYGCETL